MSPWVLSVRASSSLEAVRVRPCRGQTRQAFSRQLQVVQGLRDVVRSSVGNRKLTEQSGFQEVQVVGVIAGGQHLSQPLGLA